MTTWSKRSRAARRGDDLDVAVVARDRATGRAQADAVAKRRRQRLDVARRAAGDRRPARPVAKAEHAVVGEELGDEARREASPSGAGRPTTRPTAAARSAARRTRARSGGARGSRASTRRSPRASSRRRSARLKRSRSTIMRWKRGLTRLPRLAEQPARRAADTRSPLLALDREAHVRRLARDAEAVEQPREVRVVAVVHHDEARVDVMCLDAPCRPGSCSCARPRRRRPRTRRSRARGAAGAPRPARRRPRRRSRSSSGRVAAVAVLRVLSLSASRQLNLRRRRASRITSRPCSFSALGGVSAPRRRTRPPMKRVATPPTTPSARPPRQRHQRAPEPLQVHPGPLRRVLALAEGRRAVHRRPPRRGRLPDRRGARAARQHVELDRRALLPGARLRGLSRAAGGRARGIPPRARQDRRARRVVAVGAAVLARPERVRDGAGRRPPERRGDRAQGLAQRRRSADRGDRRRPRRCSSPAPTRWPSSPATCATC